MTGREKRVRRPKPPSAGPKGLSPPIINHRLSFINPNGFTLIELLVVISILALLMAILLPTLQRVRNQAKAAACQAKLRQWGLAFKMYTDDNDGRWFEKSQNGLWALNWLRLAWPTSPLRDMGACPRATSRWDDWHYPDAFTAWCPKRSSPVAWTASGVPIYGPISYGFNPVVTWPPAQLPNWEIAARDVYWATCDVQGAARIPVFFDSSYYTGSAVYDAGPPLCDRGAMLIDGGWPMCINRHEGGINMLFMDWSVRKVGLKELWTLKWDRQFDTAGPWTKQGGVLPEDWPQWMRRFKDY